jgi:hypothetical protein
MELSARWLQNAVKGWSCAGWTVGRGGDKILEKGVDTCQGALYKFSPVNIREN